MSDPVSGVTPYLTIRDGRAAEAADTYVRAFGAVEAVRHIGEDTKRLMHCHLKLNGADLFFSDDFSADFGQPPSSPPSGVMIHLEVDDVDAWFARAVSAGLTVFMPLADMPWGDRYGQLVDPFGHKWALSTPLKSGG